MNFFLKYIGEDKNLLKILVLIIIFLAIVKIPSIIKADMQPWDEGLYATRVLSIHINGDFWDQAEHSVGRFYSASHPPLLIWAGYFVTLIGGVNSITLKLIPFISSLFCIYLMLLIGKKTDKMRNAVVAVIIFSSTILFNIFSKRFQFDIPYLLLVIISFYIFLTYLEDNKKYKLYILGIVFGLSLMIKILVGLFIPLVIFFYFLLMRKKINFRIIDFIIFFFIGILVALPWHLYMFLAYGREFLDYFFVYHIFDRAVYGVEQNIKSSGPLYYLNYFLSIIPYGFLFLFSIFEDFKRRKEFNKFDIFLYIWFIIGLIIITTFKTKLESYTLFILIPASFIIASVIPKFKDYSRTTKIIASFLLIINILWMISYPQRWHYLNSILQNANNSLLITLAVLLFSIIALFFISRKQNYNNFLYSLIIIFFFAVNIYYAVKIPEWENNYKLSECKQLIDYNGKKQIYYVGNTGTDNKYNAQFSFYFKGIDLGWQNDNYKYYFCDTRYGTDSIKNILKTANHKECSVIIESDNINRDDELNPDLFIPENFEMVKKTTGYKLYQKK